MSPHKKKISDSPAYSSAQLTILVLLRMAIGWHFLYEGLAKLLNPYWTSAEFLMESKGLFSGIFQSLAASPSALKVVDALNIWGLIAIGLGLMTGFLARVACLAGMVLIVLYYLCNPPFPGYAYKAPSEGSYLFVNKNVVELFALWVLVLFPTSRLVGIDGLIFRSRRTGRT